MGGRYEVAELIGRGGMAEVHLGHDTRLGRQVAIKMLRSDLARDPSFIKRFRREAQSSAGLNHASIVAVYDSGEDHTVESGGARVAVPYMVMEYVEGETLREVLNERGKLPTEEACRVTEGVLDALAYSHRMGIVHRDIKPANVMVAKDGSVKVMDFGIARAIADTAATMTQTQAVIGTAQYLSPEQAQGHAVDARSDLYSAGCMLYELLTGRPPFIGDSPVSIAYQHVGEQPVPPSTIEESLGEELDAVVLHSLAKPREKRYQDAASFRSDLQCARLRRPISPAASASLAAFAAGAASSLRTSEPTEVYAAQTSPADGSTPVPAPGSVTSTFPAAVDHDAGRRRHGARVALLVVAMLAALTLLGFGIVQYRQVQAEAAKVGVPQLVNLPEATAKMRLADQELVGKSTQAAHDTIPEGSVVSQNPDPGVLVEKGITITYVVSTGPSSVLVPDLAGMTVEEATAELEKVKLTVGTTAKVDSKEPKDRIVSSAPKAGESLAPGAKVNLSVSTGQVVVPDLTGKTVDEAASMLFGLGLKMDTSFRTTSRARAGTVVDQNPDDKEKVDVGTEVTIVVAQRAAPRPTVTTTRPAEPTPEPTTPEPAPTTPNPTPSISITLP
ncbi:serine/threonine protein kinase [Knoellia sinensis KCTC 19936]|uniref:non-specific serine/threonine protein kinase n=1 Tax=Knoellia sinensis KCTC 19936 TaxID=1385520 RepID=A0A0A0J370_9MICO|nr:serine/threonine protein kinase [Knoellia sinensis KCTC 19936]